MALRIVRCFLTIVATVLAWPSTAHACSCGGAPSSAAAIRGADLIFVGTVARAERPSPHSQKNADGSIGVGGPAPLVATFDVAHTYLGAPARQVVVVGNGTDCDQSFEPGEGWLVYARVHDGRITTTKCTRTRLRERASSDLAYLEGLEQKREQGILYGNVLRRMVRADGQPALQGLFQSLQVVAASDGRRTEVTTDPWGPYQLVLPPGDYDVWVERSGRPVGPKQSVHIAASVDRQLALIAEYED